MNSIWNDLEEKELVYYCMERDGAFHNYTFYENGSVMIHSNTDDGGDIFLLSDELARITSLAKLFRDRRDNRKLKEK